MADVICNYCGKPAVLITGAQLYRGRPDLADKKFWHCAPCEAYVGCHAAGSGPGYTRGDGTVPLGRLAKPELRLLKQRVHAVFDGYWNRLLRAEVATAGKFPKGAQQRLRSAAYARLGADLNLTPDQCHIAMFDEALCKRAISTVYAWVLNDDKESE